MKTATDVMTAEEFFEWANLPENAGKHHELERGRIVEVSRAGELHGIVCINVGYLLAGYIRRRRKGFACGNDTGVIWETTPDIVRGPDVIFYDENRSYREYNQRYSDDIPTLIVEVLSPNDRPHRVIQRICEFLDWGVKLAWVIDPIDRTVCVYRAEHRPIVLDETRELTGEDVLPDFRCPVAELFYSAGDDASPPA